MYPIKGGEATGLDIEFESYKIAHDLPEVKLLTWIYHDKPSKDGSKLVRITSVTILTPIGKDSTQALLFTGVSGCSELDCFNKKDGFNRAYGRACKKLAAFLRGQGQPDGTVKLTQLRHEIDKWIMQHAFQAKMDFLKTVYAQRIALAKAKGKVVEVPVLAL